MLEREMPSDYERVEQAIRFLDEHANEQPSLVRVAESVGLSDSHFQRLFKRWAGVSPKRFLQYITAEHAREVLSESENVLDAAYETGLSGPGRLHDLTVNVHALTPGEMRAGGAGVAFHTGEAETRFGRASISWTDRGVSALTFDGDARERWPNAEYQVDAKGAQALADRLFDGGAATLQLKGTNFQIRVWEALLRIPEGRLATYKDIAKEVRTPAASRAVGTAVGANPIAYLIPCHRVIRTTGAFGGYRWGMARKQAMVGWEAAQRARSAAHRPPQ